MLTKLSKILTIFVAVASLLFMGFAITQYAGGRNWKDETRDSSLENYIFTQSAGENPTWTAERKGAAAGNGEPSCEPIMPA